jgi:gas vesicle protein GvpA/GvpJ/GvpM family
VTRLAGSSDSLADILERVLDKGVVIAGDIGISVVDVELLTLRIRLFIASAQTAREMGMDWWTNDPFFAPNAARAELDEPKQKNDLAARVADLEARLLEAVPSRPEEPR